MIGDDRADLRGLIVDADDHDGPGETPCATSGREPGAVDGARHREADERERADGEDPSGHDLDAADAVDRRGARGQHRARPGRARPARPFASSPPERGRGAAWRSASTLRPRTGTRPTSRRTPKEDAGVGQRSWVRVHATASATTSAALSDRRRSADPAPATPPSASPTSSSEARSINAPSCLCPILLANRSSRTTMLMPDRRLLSVFCGSRLTDHPTRPGPPPRGIALLFVVPALAVLPRRVTVSAISGAVNTFHRRVSCHFRNEPTLRVDGPSERGIWRRSGLTTGPPRLARDRPSGVASTTTMAPSAISPASRALASRSATSRWMTRFSGRAPKAGS